MSTNILKIFGLNICMLTALTGCATLDNKPQPLPQNDPAMLKLNGVAEQAEQSMQVLSQLQVAKDQSAITLAGAKQAAISATATPQGWQRHTNIEFTGPFYELVQQLAQGADYKLYVAGKMPANPPIVTVQGNNRDLMQVLREVVAQLPPYMSIRVYPATRSVVLTIINVGA